MGKNKYKEIYLFMDFFKILKNAINKLYSQFISNNISTNIDSFGNNNTVQVINNKSKNSIKNENSKEISDKMILEQINDNMEDDKKIIISENKKKSEKKNINNKDKCDLSLNNNIENKINDVNNKDNNIKNNNTI